MTIWNQAKLKSQARQHRRSVFAAVGPGVPIHDSHACPSCGYLKCSCGTARQPANRALHEARERAVVASVPASAWKPVHAALDKMHNVGRQLASSSWPERADVPDDRYARLELRDVERTARVVRRDNDTYMCSSCGAVALPSHAACTNCSARFR